MMAEFTFHLMDRSHRLPVGPLLRRKAYTAIAAKMARTVHAVIKHGEPYHPFFEGGEPRRKDPCLIGAVEAVR